MTGEDHFRQAYKEGSTPWDIGKPDFNLVQSVTEDEPERGRGGEWESNLLYNDI